MLRPGGTVQPCGGKSCHNNDTCLPSPNNQQRNTLLRADSFHPPHLIENVPYGQFQRLRRLCGKEEEFIKQADDMSARFHNRSYNSDVITRARTKAHALERSSLLTKKVRSENASNRSTRPVFVTQYSTQAKQISRIVNKNWGIIESDPVLKQIFPEPPLALTNGLLHYKINLSTVISLRKINRLGLKTYRFV